MPRRGVRIAALLAVAAAGVALVLCLRAGGGAARAVAPAKVADRGERAGPSERDEALRTSPVGAGTTERSVLGELAPEPSLRTGERGAFLRVVDDDGAPAAAFAFEADFVWLEPDGASEQLEARPARVETDEQGFADLASVLAEHERALSVAGRARAQAVVLSSSIEPAFSLAPRRIERDALGATREAAATVVRSRRAVAKVRGVLVDASSGGPLADYPLRIAGWRENAAVDSEATDALRPWHTPPTRWWMTTDASGRFESEVALPEAEVVLLTYEKVRAVLDHAIGVDGLGIERPIAVSVGAVVLLDFDAPPGYARTDFIAALRRDGRTAQTWTSELPTPRDAFGGSRADGNAAPVEAGSPCKVRVPHEQVVRELPSYLVLQSRDRRCTGSALVEALEPYATKPLRVEIETRDALEVEVVWPAPDAKGRSLERLGLTLMLPAAFAADPEGRPEATGWIERRNGEARTRGVLVGFTAGPQHLSAGTWTLPWDEVRPEPIEMELVLPRAEPLVLEPRLLPPIATYRVEGVVRTRSGEPLDGKDGRAELESLDAGVFGMSEVVTWSGGVGRFGIRDVPEGSTELSLWWTKGWFEHVPKELRVDVPCEPIAIEVLDDVPHEELVARVIDPQAEGRLTIYVGRRGATARANHAVRPADVRVLEDGRRAFELVCGPYPAGEPVEQIELAMEGFEHVWLTDRDVPPADERGRRVVEIVPRRGWSARVQVVSGSGEDAQPLSGIVLRFDGVETPASDDAGYLIHRAPTQPQRVEVATPGWELVERGSYFGRGSVLASGRFTLDDGELTVELRARGE